MQDFPSFMKNPRCRIGESQQHTEDIEGYYLEGEGGCQMAFWTCKRDRASEEHTLLFDEYMVCIAGEYTAILNGREIVLHPGDELVIPKGTRQSSRSIAGTRTIHFFDGKRIKK
ncbi:MAG: cupin domain-containing protein [Christensenellales bacterium]